ncbi:MAG: hypothetical protein C5B49_06245 [Bdellovibrio sp.]|nr:MAG: hypothetical protein C5B49_06245 [Bdellovibrio sp.]
MKNILLCFHHRLAGLLGLSFVILALGSLAPVRSFADTNGFTGPAGKAGPKSSKKPSKKSQNKSAISAKSAKKSDSNSMTRKQAHGEEYSTSHSFDGARINGKVQEGQLRRIVIENDKSIEDLLGVRKNFDDREREENERNLSW